MQCSEKESFMDDNYYNRDMLVDLLNCHLSKGLKGVMNRMIFQKMLQIC